MWRSVSLRASECVCLQGDYYLIHWDEWSVCISSVQLTLSNNRCLSLSFTPPSPHPGAHCSPFTLIRPHLLFTRRTKDEWHFYLVEERSNKDRRDRKIEHRAVEVEEASLSVDICRCRAEQEGVIVPLWQGSTTVRINSDTPFDAPLIPGSLVLLLGLWCSSSSLFLSLSLSLADSVSSTVFMCDISVCPPDYCIIISFVTKHQAVKVVLKIFQAVFFLLIKEKQRGLTQICAAILTIHLFYLQLELRWSNMCVCVGTNVSPVMSYSNTVVI